MTAEPAVTGQGIPSDLELQVNPECTFASMHPLFLGREKFVHRPFTFCLTLRTSWMRIMGHSWKHTP